MVRREGMMPRRIGGVVALAAGLALVAAACTRGGDEAGQPRGEARGAQAESALDRVIEAGQVRCGVNETVPGFGFETEAGTLEGFDIDFCKAIAAAVLGTPDPQEGEHFQLVPIDADFRFSALRNGRYDVLVRNTTWTSSRDGFEGEGVAFAHPNFYDAQGMMVKEGEVASIDELDGATICVTAGTTTELNLADYFQANNLDFEPLVFEDNEQILPAFTQGRCQGWTSDISQLSGLKAQFESETGPLVILPDIMSKEPLAPAVLDGDTRWLDVVNWVVNGIILAEELGVTSENVVDEAEDPSEPQIASLLGVPFQGAEDVTFEHGLGIDDTFMQNVLQAVGNYGEIFDRHLTPIELERGINALWTDGGIQYAMPFR
jgi:general L-amino acid transport system substrate-binding protein